MNNIKFLLFFCALTFLTRIAGFSQANPSIAVVPLNSGLVSLGGTLDLEITIGNTGVANIPAFKLRPIITVPSIVTVLPDAQQTGLPPGWTIVTNTGSQIRICNGSDVIAGLTSRTIFIKVQGVAIGGPSTFAGQINFANGTNCAVAGAAVSGNNTADDFSTSTIQVVAGCSMTLSATAGTILCNGGTASITATTAAATGPVEYSITGGAPFQPGNVFNNVAAGVYTVTAREVNNPLTCVATTTVTITEPAAIPTPAVNIVQPTCATADAAVTITSATAGLTFKIDGGSFAAYPVGGYLLPSGPHSITAQNASNCTSAVTSFTVNAQPPTPPAPVTGTVTQPDCTVSTGSVVLTDLPAGNWVIQPGNITGNTTTATLSNLAAGIYAFTVTNAAGCTSVPAAGVEIVAVVDAPEAPLVTATQPSCTVATGSIVITSVVTALTFSLDAGAFGPYPAGGYTGLAAGPHNLIAKNASGCLSPFTNFTINTQPASPAAPAVSVTQPTCTVATGTITVTSATTGLDFSLDGAAFAPYPTGGYTTTAGIHSLAVQNNSGCTPNVTNNIVVNAQPATPSVTTAFTPVTCFGSSSTITATATGGVLPYEYNINAGAYQSANTFSVNAGSYTIAVKDANGCVGNSGNIVIAQPAVISATATAAAIACNGGTTTLTVQATGGLGAYEYSLNGGAFQAGNTFTVAAGSYTADVRITGNPSCMASVNGNINVTQPAVLKATVNAPAIAVCGGTSFANVTATGGTAPYTGTGRFEKGPGTWSFTVTDAKGCSTAAEAVIIPPGCMDIEVFPNPASSSITINHSAADANAYLQVFSQNGTRVMTHRVPQNHFITTLDISKLSAGTYIMVYIKKRKKKETRFIKLNK